MPLNIYVINKQQFFFNSDFQKQLVLFQLCYKASGQRKNIYEIKLIQVHRYAFKQRDLNNYSTIQEIQLGGKRPVVIFYQVKRNH